MGAAETQGARRDFREAAVEVSRRVLAARRVSDVDRADLSKLGASLCISAPGDPAKFRRKLGVRLIVLTVLGFGGALAGWLIMKFSGSGNESVAEPMRPMTWVGVAATLCGMISLLSALGVQRRAIVRHLNQNALLRGAAPARDAIIVSVEDPLTFQNLKLVADDVAEMSIDAARRLAVIEGFSHRYVIRGEDVIDCYSAQGPSESGVEIVYRIGEVRLSLVLIYNSLFIAFRRKLHLLRRNPIATKLEEGLGIRVRK
jgi:hypothetical protein